MVLSQYIKEPDELELEGQQPSDIASEYIKEPEDLLIEIPRLSLGKIPEPEFVSEKEQRARLIKPTSVKQRVAQAKEFLTTDQFQQHEQQLIKDLQAKIYRGEPIDPIQMGYYREYLDIPEPETQMRVPEKRETMTAKGWQPASKVGKLPPPEMDLTTGEIKPVEPKPEQTEISPVEAFKEQWKTSAYLSSQSAWGALQQMGLSTISGIMDLNKRIPTPQFIKNVRNKIANTIGYDIEGIEQKSREKLDDLILDTALYRKQIGDEIRKEGGMAEEVAQNIGDEFLSSAVALIGLGALKLFGNAPTIRESLKAAAKLAGITYATTEGDTIDRAKAATGAGLFMLTPIPAGRMAKNWSAKLVNTALNFGVDLFTGKIGQAVTEAKNKAIEKGEPDKWKEELTTTLTPALLLEGAFGLLARAKTPQQVKQVKSLYNELSPEILDSIKKVSPEMRAEWEKAVELETKKAEELPEERKVSDAIKEREVQEGDLGEYRGIDAQRQAADAGRSDRYARGGIESERQIAEVGKKPSQRVEPTLEVAEMPLEAVKTTEGIPRQPPAEIGAEMPAKVGRKPSEKVDYTVHTQKGYDWEKRGKQWYRISYTIGKDGSPIENREIVKLDQGKLKWLEKNKRPFLEEQILPPPAPTTTEKIETPAPVKAGEPGTRKIVEVRVGARIPKGRRGQVSFETDPIRAFVEERGGIAPDRDPQTKKIIGWEEYKAIPLRYRGRTKLDVMADDMKREGLVGEDFDGEALRQHLAQPIKKGITKEQYTKQQYEERQDFLKTHETVTSDKLKVGDKFKIDGEKFRVAEEGDTALKVIDGTTKYIPYQTPKGEFEQFYIDKGSLEKAITPVAETKGELPLGKQDLTFVSELEKPPKVVAREQVAEAKRIEEAKKKKLEEMAQELPVAKTKPLTDKELITKPLAEIKTVATREGIEVAGKGRKQIVDEVQTKQSETAKEKILDDLPVPEELKRKPGLRNMAGALGVEKPLRIDTSVVNEAADMQRVFDKQRADVNAKFKTPLSKIRDEVSANLFGTDIPITRRLMEANGRDVVIAKVLSRGWGEKTELDLNDALADIKATIPHKLDYAFNDFLQARRTIEVSNLMREKRGVQSELFAEGELPEVILSPGGKGVKESRAWMNEFQKQHPKEMKAMEEAGKKWDNTMKGVVDEYLSEGLIDKEFHDYLVKNHPHFSPRKFLQHIDPEMSVQVQGKKISVPDSGIQALDVGSEKSLVNDSSFLLADVLSRKNSRIAKNRANKALYEYASENRDNPLGIKILSEQEAAKGVSPELSTVSVMIDGKPKVMAGDANLIKYWHESSPALNQQTASIIKTLSGTKIVKALATGYNPAFALYNPPRDIQHYWYAATAYGGTGYSRHLPIALAQITKDIIKVMPDAVGRKGRYRDYINEGGGMGLLTTQGRLGRSPYGYSTIRNEALRQVERVGSWLPETSEILTRLAIREREIRSGKTPREATYIARQVLDFSQGGKLVKTMDNAIPYLNAAMQATRGTLDAWRYSPKEALYKTAQLIALGAISAILRKRLNEKTDDAIPDSQRVTKWNFPLPYYKIDKNGNKRYFYIPVPKEQAQQIFSTIGEELARRAMGEKVSFQRLRMAFDNLSPTDISNLPPLLAAILTYVMNKDFWTNDDIWKGREVSPSKEVYPTTPEAWKKAGEITGLSPERLRKSAGKLIPNNPFIQLFGGIQSPIEYSKDDAIMQKMFTLISQTPVINRFMKVTPSVDLTDDEIKKAEKYEINATYPDGDTKPRHIIRQMIKEKETEANDLRQISDYKMDIMIGQIKNKKLNVEELHKWLESLDDDEFKRLTQRLKKKYPEVYNK